MPAERFYQEVFSSGGASDIASRSCKVVLEKSKKTLDYEGRQSLLEFLEEHQV